MAFLREHRLLLCLVALLFALGHAHQVFGRFKLHHHGFEMHSLGEVHEHEGGEHHEDDGDPDKDADHMLLDHAVVAEVPALIASLIVGLHPVAVVEVCAEATPEAPVAGIEHPPQLRIA